MNSFDVIVCGSGPAGLSAALEASRKPGTSVLLIERMERLGVKLLASGNGRCNVSNILSPEDFMASFGRSGRFLNDALRFAPREWLFDFLGSSGVPVELTDGFHYFPKSGKAFDILTAFVSQIRAGGTAIRLKSTLEKIRRDPASGAVSGVVINGEDVACRKLVLACGGTAMSKLGGTSMGLKLAESEGHTILPPLPAMAPLFLKEDWVRSLTGLALPHARLFFGTGRKKMETSGELLFTHDGFSGPAAIDLSAWAAEAYRNNGNELELYFQADASMGVPEWCAQIEEWRRTEPKRYLRTALGWKLTSNLGETLCELAGLAERKLYELNNAERDRLLELLTAAPLHLAALAPMEKAMAMKGGVCLKEVDPKTLQSRLVPGLYFAGELLDLVGPCGGYNIQSAFSAGRLAGSSAVL